MTSLDTSARAARHAALGDPARLAIIDELRRSDRSPVELGDMLDMPSNLLAHHLDVLEQVGLIERSRSSGDGRRRYVHLRLGALEELTPAATLRPMRTGRPVFVCRANSARSQLAAALWHQATGSPASSAGTHPADRVHPGAIAAGRRAGIDLTHAAPRPLRPRDRSASLVVTVCDQAHEELGPDPSWLHWSVPDPVPMDTVAAFDATVAELRARIEQITADHRVAS